MKGNLRRRPIGIFDSGVGGLTLFRSIQELLPNESLIYFGNTARLPYGTKSPESVCRFSLQIGCFLQRHNIKALVVACHTASSTAFSRLSKLFLGEKLQKPHLVCLEELDSDIRL